MQKNIDQSNMRQVILDFPKQFRIGLEAAKNAKAPNVQHPISNIIIAGMGGSALPGDVFKMVNNDYCYQIAYFIHRNYNLPSMADKNS